MTDPIPPGLRARIASLRGFDTLCLPAGQLRDLLADYDRAREQTNEPDWQLDVFVPGRAAPQGSIKAVIHRSTGRAVAIKDNNTKQKSWRQDVRDLVAVAWAARPPIDGPVQIRIDFVMPRPVSTPKRSTPPAIRKPDGDKLERAVWDSLTDVVWIDDSRVVEWAGTKRIAEIGETPGARVRLRATEAVPVPSASARSLPERAGAL